ncbi:carboxypeptidase-like regulatory domain-containing protein [Peristeroidobacter agariperforans]|uniref:carboxypeptidase-like regulatory domain-containing protein n=1 Tax=Peristeroidobacter agariperforans TaxID=268404 RepID=UPI00101DD951|nr:carboxypeptidase-like regulatory domain-containing protein [Peristeroidobacter agariperforans]
MSSLRSGRSLGKAVLSTLMLSALAACGGGGGSSDGTGNNNGGNGNGNPPAPTMSRLTLTGTVTDAPIPSAVVTATIGSQTFTTTADANGNYRLELAVEESAAGGFITLKAKGAGAQSYVEFTSRLGAFQALKTQAGSDEVLSSSENFATQITNVSTALAVLLQEANGGQAVNSQTLIDTLTPKLSAEALLRLAAAIKLLVDQPDVYPMPSGQTSLQSLLANATLREELVTDLFIQNPTTFRNAQSAIASDPTLTQPITTASLPSTLTAASLRNDVAAYGISDRTVSYTFNSNGTGVASTATRNLNMTWTVSGASVEITYDDGPVEMGGWELASCPGDDYGDTPAEYEVAYSTPGVKLTLLNKDLLAITESRHVVARGCGTIGPQPEIVTEARTILDDQDFLPFDIAELRDSTRTLWIYNRDPDGEYVGRSFMPDVAQLNANGTGTTRAFGKQFSWSLDASGALNIAFVDGVTARFRSIRELDSVATDVLYEFTLPSGRRVDAGASLRTDPQQQLAFTPDHVLGRHYFFGLDRAPIAPGAKGSRWRFDAGGLGTREAEYLDQNGNLYVRDSSSGGYYSYWAFEWIIEGDELVLKYCEPDWVPCNLTQDAHMTVLARDGARTYWFETWRQYVPDVDQGFLTDTLIRYYDYEPFDAPSAVASKASSARP